jgi:adenine-specific DNA-methyltransferase
MPHTDPKDNQILKLQKENERIKKQLTKFSKERYGLFWFDVPEAFEDDVENKLPILEEVPKLAIKNKDNEPTHILIEGDNYHALTCLNYTHKGKIDVIYIDPPYNTGSDGFKYKDKRILDKYPDGTEVPKDNPLRHSYWLSFMRKRLELARDLLKDKGVMFISIDDNEVAQLKLLCNEIFVENNVEVYIWDVKDENEGAMPKTAKYTVRKEHEYLVVCFKNKQKIKFNRYLEFTYINDEEWNNSDKDKRGNWMSGNISRGESDKQGCNFFTITTPTGKKYSRNWSISEDEYIALLKDNRIYFSKKGNGVPRIKIFKNEPRLVTQSSIFSNLKSSISGKNLITEILGKCDFNHPKPIELIKRIIDVVSDKDSIILDFFAGTGTTGHAVLELNKKDTGKRQFILGTNDENKICSEICYPRIKKIIEGYKTKKESVAGLGNSLKYFKTAFVGKNNILNVTDKDKIELAHNAGAMLAIAENTLEEIEQNSYYQLFENEVRYTAVYFKEELDKFDVFAKKVTDLKKPVTVYIFSWDKELEFNEFENNKNIAVKTIPQPILEIYKQIYNLV